MKLQLARSERAKRRRVSQPQCDAAAEDLLRILTGVVLAGVRADTPDLTARQLAVFLTVYLTSRRQTVRGLAAQLRLHRPAITRALDRLEEFDLTRREPDPADGRSVLVGRTQAGTRLLDWLKARSAEAAIGVQGSENGRKRSGPAAQPDLDGADRQSTHQGALA